MAYEQVLPNDTANQIADFIQERYVGAASMMAAAEAIEREMTTIAANPFLGTPIYGGPYESRRIHRFVAASGDVTHTVEFAYWINPRRPVVVFSGFREVPPTLL